MTKSARDHATDNNRVNAIYAAFIHTEMAADPIFRDMILGLHPIGRLGTVEEIAEVVLWLSRDKSAFVTGHSLAADGGATLG